MYKIYRIVDNTNGNIYIGITKQSLKARKNQHKSHKKCMSREIIKNGDYKIELIRLLSIQNPFKEDKMKDYSIKRDKIRGNWYLSMGGSPYSNNLSLLKIDYNLFFYSNF